MKKLTWLSGLATFVAAGVYTVVSLNRWEWSRALFFGLVFLVAEIGLATGLVLRKLDRVLEELEIRREGDERQLRALLRESRPELHRFAWLDGRELTNRTGVFITMLVGGGVLLSAVAWLIDRIAGATVGNHLDSRLARDLVHIRYPSEGMLVDDVTVLAQTVPYAQDPDLRALLRRPHR